MSSEYQIETRRRSRSKTPFLRSSCDHENCEYADEEGHVHHHHQAKKKAPSVQTIVEEAVEVTSSSSSGAAPNSGKLAKQSTKSSDYYSDDTSPERKDKRKSESTTTTTTTTTITTKSSSTTLVNNQDISRLLYGATTSTPKNNSHLTASMEERLRRSKEISQNELNSAFERSQHLLQNRSNRTFSGSSNTTVSSIDLSKINPEDHLAYMEYKRFGEYWNKTPKTDYTYSEFSPYRRELAPGVVAMPNMSRRSLAKHTDRVNYMVNRDPDNEEFIRRRYGYQEQHIAKRQESERLVYDSTDEVDYQLQAKRNYLNGGNRYGGSGLQNDISWFMRLVTTIVTTVTTITETLTGQGNRAKGVSGQQAAYYSGATNLDERRGFFGAIGHGIASLWFAIFRGIYTVISYALLADFWLLKTEQEGKRQSKKRFLWLLLLLLPLLGGLYYYINPDESFPPKHFSELPLTLKFPELPKINVSAYLNPEHYESLKSGALRRYDEFRFWSDEYLLYLKQYSQDLINEGRKLFEKTQEEQQKQEHYERL